MIGRQVIRTSREFTLEELHAFMKEHWDTEQYNHFLIGRPTAASVEKYILLPAYLFTINYGGQDYSFAVNGQTGKITGTLPSDKSLKRKMFFKRLLIILLLVLGFSFVNYMMGR